MNRITSLILVLGALIFSERCMAESGNWRVSVAGGYGTVGMVAVNENAEANSEILAKQMEAEVAVYGPTEAPSMKVDKSTGGVSLGVDLGNKVSSRGGITVRAGYLKPNELSIRASARKVSQPGIGDQFASINITTAITVISLMAGGWIEGGEKRGVNYSGFLFVGPAQASSVVKGQYMVTGSGQGAYSYAYSGTGIGGEIGGRLGVGIGKASSMFVETGYRLITIGKMKADKDYDDLNDGTIDLKKGTVIKDVAGKALKFDFSGINIKAGFTIPF